MPHRVVVRELRTLGEFVQVQEVARAAWGFDDRQLPAVADLQAVSHVGGLTAGAFEGRDLVGFVHGMPRTNLARPCQHSHLLAIRPEAQGRGLAVRLKFFQRRWCLDHGIRLVTWTYDPLIVKNAHLNLVRLRARALAYIRDLYGPLGGIYGQLPTDRFEVYWRLDDPAVDEAARGRAREAADAEALPRVAGSRLPSGRRLAVEIPLGAPGLYASEPARALTERLRLRRIAAALLAKGYQATSLQVRAASALYVFVRPRDRPALFGRRQYALRLASVKIPPVRARARSLPSPARPCTRRRSC